MKHTIEPEREKDSYTRQRPSIDIAAAEFAHPKNIRTGRGRILYDGPTDSWVLPGGKRTRSIEAAFQAAKAIDQMSR